MESKIIPPTVGRVVHYYPSEKDEPFATTGTGEPLAAIIARVWNNRMVNLSVFDANGYPIARTSVHLVQPGDDYIPEHEYCSWMPYQVGQAAKTEELENKLAEEGVKP